MEFDGHKCFTKKLDLRLQRITLKISIKLDWQNGLVKGKVDSGIFKTLQIAKNHSFEFRKKSKANLDLKIRMFWFKIWPDWQHGSRQSFSLKFRKSRGIRM